MNNAFAGKVAVVTGAVRGIGMGRKSTDGELSRWEHPKIQRQFRA